MAAPRPSAPRLRIDRLTVEKFRSLRHVAWPQDGMGWDGMVPEIALVGGANGSGKTTLLEMLFGIVRFVVDASSPDDLNNDALAMLPRGAERVDISLCTGSLTRHLTISSRTLYDASHRRGAWSIWTPDPEETESPEFSPGRDDAQAERRNLTRVCTQPEGPKLLYFPTDRAVTFPETRFKGPGNRSGDLEPAYRYRAPKEWMQSIEAILYDARWRDLNAKKRGRTDATGRNTGDPRRTGEASSLLTYRTPP